MAEVPEIQRIESESQTYAHSRIKNRTFAKLLLDKLEGGEKADTADVDAERSGVDIEYLSPDKIQ